jgi:hypothetical protein
MSKEIELSAADKEKLSGLHTSTHQHIEEIAKIIAAAIGSEGHMTHYSVSGDTAEAAGDKPARNRGLGKVKTCVRFSDGTCGCEIYPPGLCRSCRPGDLD